MLASDGAFYGTTYAGGAFGSGTLFRITPKGRFKSLHAFRANGRDGANPVGTLAEGAGGAIYGTTTAGGANCMDNGGWGCGSLFRYTSKKGVVVVHSFAGGADDGESPEAGLLMASDGQWYGTTRAGGTSNQGTVFRMAADGAATVLHSFNQAEGFSPRAALMQASNGALYGTTFYGGDDNTCGAGCGIVFKLSLAGELDVMHRFAYAEGGYAPASRLVAGPGGRLYGTAYAGGDHTNCYFGCGTVFSMSLSGDVETLHVFTGGTADGATPNASLVAIDDKHLVGSTSAGGSQQFGTVFKLKP